MGLIKRIERTMFYGAPPSVFQKAEVLRKNMTECEKIVWEYLRGNQLSGFRFKAQHPLKYFIADFYSHKAKLVIEIDGDSHNGKERKEYDEGRSFEIER